MNYHNIVKDDMRNGDGLRVTLFVAGCNHYCKGCHNPITWDPNGGIPFCGSAKEELMECLNKDYISGLTLSGGDPLYPENREEITNLCKEVKERFPNKNIWLYTGYTYEEVKELEVMQYLDVIVDGPFVQELADINYEYAGSTNQKVIRLKESGGFDV